MTEGADGGLHGIPLLLVGCLTAFAIAVVVVWLVQLAGGRPPPVVRRPILTAAEIAFHRKLVQATSLVGGLAVHPQMAMSAFLQTRPGLSAETSVATFRRFSQKRPDFVLVDRSWNVRLIVELDDPSHDARKDAERDRMTLAAGIPTVRFPDGRRVTVDEILDRLHAALRG